MTRHLSYRKVLSTIAGMYLFLVVITVVNAQAQKGTVSDNPIEIGSKDAPLKLEVFYDMQCISCAAFHPILKAALAKYQNQLQVTFRHFPISFHDKAFLAGIAVEAANQQGKGFEMIDVLLSYQNEWAWTPKFKGMIDGYAEKMGLDMAKFRPATNGTQAEGRIIMDMERGRQLKLNSVPSVFLNGKLLTYPEAMDLEETIRNR
jgi:protein-disulfide isomerase